MKKHSLYQGYLEKKSRTKSAKMICTDNKTNLQKAIHETRKEFEGILTLVTQDSGGKQIHEVERGIFQRLLALGALLLQVFLMGLNGGDVGLIHTSVDGVVRKRHSIKTRVYYSIFGKITISRWYYWARGVSSACPLDVMLNFPQDCYSYLLQEWGILLGVQGAWDKVTNILKNMLQVDLWNSSLARIAERTSRDVESFYDAHMLQVSEEEGELLVVTVDGKGVPIKKDEPSEKKVRLKKGEKPGKKKMSTVTAIYTVDRHYRKPEDIVKASMPRSNNSNDEKIKKETLARPTPQNKIVKATLEGKKAAFEDLVKQVQQRDPQSNKEHVALVDGERKLRELLIKYLPGFCIILDLYHVLEYLWVAAHVFHAEGSDAANNWVERMLELLLKGRVDDIILYLKGCSHYHELSKAKKATLMKVIGYLDHGKSFMRYDYYIAKGYPIGSGVVEGACKNLVKDRMELSGMRWTIQGAESMLGLRSISVNDLSADFWQFRIEAEYQRLYGSEFENEALIPLAA